MSEGCDTCKYFIPINNVDRRPIGICRRYPAATEVHVGEWCGEYKVSENGKSASFNHPKHGDF